MRIKTPYYTLVLIVFITLFSWQSAFSQTVIISDGTWKGVGNNAAASGNAWLFPGYNDAAWPLVEAPNAGNVIPAVVGSQSMWVLPYSDTAKMRKTFIVPVGDSYNGSISINADNEFTLYFNGVSQGFFNWWPSGPYTFNITPALQGCTQNVIGVDAANWGGPYGASLSSTINVVNPLVTPVATPATGITCNAFTANWGAVATADLYLLDVSTDPTFASFYSVYHDFNVGAVTSYNLSSLPGPGPYYYRLRAQRTNGLGTLQSCYSNTITVNITGGPAVDAGYNAYICPGSSTSLNGSGGGVPTWNPAVGLSATNIFTPVATPPATTTYTLSVNNAGCISTDSVTITIATLPTLNLTPDTSVCPGNCVDLSVSGGDYFIWSPFPGMLDSSLTTQTVCPAANTTYTVTSYTVGPNLITNGDFSGGNTGFTSSYNYSFPNFTEGEYYVGTNPQAWNGGLSPCGDNTTGAGNMMMVNGSPIANTNIWCQTVPVSSNTDYLFSTWVTPAYAVNMPILQFSINGIPLGSSFSPGGANCTWEEFFSTWNSGMITSATICIVNQNTNISGNDFAIDDISFSPVCTQTGTVDVAVIPIPVPAPNNTGPYCTGSTIQLNSPSGSATDDWAGPLGYLQNDVQNPTILNCTLGMGGDYTVTVTNAAGCSATATTTVVVNSNAAAVANNTGPYCENDTIFLSSGAGLTIYDWTGPLGFNVPANQNPNIPNATVLMSGIYTVHVTAAGGCTGTATTTVTVNAQPLILANANAPICNGSNVTLNGNGAFNYTWLGPNGFNANGQSPVINNVGVIDNGTYTVTGTDANNCTSTATVNVVSFPVPVASFVGDNLTGCAPLCVNFTDQSNGNGGVINGWNWNIQGEPAVSSQNTSACFGNPGTYDASLTVTTTDGCTNTLTLANYITVTSNPAANFTYAPQTISMSAPDVNFGNTSFAATSYIWDFGDGGTSIATNAQHTYSDTGTYCVNLIASNAMGCTDTVTHCLIVNPIFTLYIPNSFTPNQDGVNESFMIYGNGISTIDVKIFDRWGEEIFNFTDINKGWGGHTRNGSLCQQDTYVYHVDVVDVLNKDHQYVGKVNLIR
jgi:gliding motility-associated-like protein